MKARICPICHGRNAAMAFVCSECGESLDRVSPSDVAEPSADAESKPRGTLQEATSIKEASHLFIESVLPRGLVARIDDGFVVGRGADVDLAGIDPTDQTSRRHVVFRLVDNRWWVENLSATSPTMVCDFPLEKGRKRIVVDGDRLILGDKEFVLRIR